MLFSSGFNSVDEDFKEELTLSRKLSIASPSARHDGKDICRMKKEMRVLFAKVNHISYIPSDCTYDGPCAGTCSKCEEETAMLMDIAKKNKEVIYPKYAIERGYISNEGRINL